MSPSLTPAFANGWRKLPNELKIEVLSRILPYRKTLHVEILSEIARRNNGRTIDFPIDPQLMWCLLDHPEFSDFMMDVLFNNHKFVVTSYLPRHEYPLRSMFSNIKRLQLIVQANGPNWQWLAEVARGAHGFDSIREVDLTVWVLNVRYDEFCNQVRRTRVIVWDVELLRIRLRHWPAWLVAAQRRMLEALVQEHMARRDGMRAQFSPSA